MSLDDNLCEPLMRSNIQERQYTNDLQRDIRRAGVVLP